MKYFNVKTKGSEEYTVLSEEVIENLKKNPKADLEIGEEVDSSGRNKADALAFKKLLNKEKRNAGV